MSDSITPACARQRVYLLHFIEPYKHARHYLGSADDLSARLDQHRKGTGARLTQVVKEAGISWVVARTWVGGRILEKRLKAQHSGVRLCPICGGKITLEEVLAAQPAPSDRVPGRRVPMGNGRPVFFH
jgi:predicted GIY-YIG superfamily endonuclease